MYTSTPLNYNYNTPKKYTPNKKSYNFLLSSTTSMNWI